MDEQYQIRDVAELEAATGTPNPFVRSKIVTRLDELMIEFIRKSPLVFVATTDADGGVDVSPKGDPAGFVRVDDCGNLRIPERPGNQLTIGFRNILCNGRIGLIFVAPNQRETLRVKGCATLHKDPDVLREMAMNGKPALLYTHVRVEECFIHCGKALVRSHLWQPENWETTHRSIGGLQLASVVGARSDEEIDASAKRLETQYRDHLY
ncbi:phosphohydrolase [Novosphingobium endophyticum]|uniref:Phosphohydrolase n=1 Tax=Novosphingobium endophyticum TaxID=1955250 RepID=A0A916TU23_9SPHN|nr:MSMEG_1061 family FMN-dependent PPOX-type flavoprotein [Novosphingobium endophyticum]GGC05702.1 phosphohydrolase [Novosphingobium endophyticum]